MVAGGLLFVCYVFGWLAPITDPLAAALAKVAAPAYAAGTRLRDAFAGAPDRAANEVLQRSLEDLTVENAKLRTLVPENEALKAAMRFRERFRDEAVLARVISGSADDALMALVIDRGSEDGVLPDQPVIVGDGIVIGKVLEARRRTAVVLLLSDSRSRLAVTIQNADDTLGVLEGDRGLSVSIGLIPQTAEISPGDVVVTSGAEPGIRRGLPIGAVTKVVKNSQDPFQSADVQPFFSTVHPVFVQVLVPSESP
jgi:rod shape-determining protein MreC